MLFVKARFILKALFVLDKRKFASSSVFGVFQFMQISLNFKNYFGNLKARGPRVKECESFLIFSY